MCFWGCRGRDAAQQPKGTGCPRDWDWSTPNLNRAKTEKVCLSIRDAIYMLYDIYLIYHLSIKHPFICQLSISPSLNYLSLFYLSIYHLSIYQASIHLTIINLSIHLSVICLIDPSIYLSNHLSIHVSLIYASIHLSHDFAFYLSICGDILIVTTGRWGAPGTWWVETREAAPQPTGPRTPRIRVIQPQISVVPRLRHPGLCIKYSYFPNIYSVDITESRNMFWQAKHYLPYLWIQFSVRSRNVYYQSPKIPHEQM